MRVTVLANGAMDFINQVFMDLLAEDGLVVLARCDVAFEMHGFCKELRKFITP